MVGSKDIGIYYVIGFFVVVFSFLILLVVYATGLWYWGLALGIFLLIFLIQLFNRLSAK